MNLFRHIDRSRFDFDFLYYTQEKTAYDDEIEALGGRILRITPTSPPGFERRIKKMLKAAGPYDVVHSHTMFNSGVVLYAAARAGVKKRIAHAHSSGDKDGRGRKFYRAVMRRLILRYANEYIACSRQAGNYLFGKKHFSKQGFVLKNALDFSAYLPGAADDRIRTDYRKALGIDPCFSTVVTHIGRFDPVKNHRFILELACAMCRGNDSLRFLLAGDGPLLGEVQNFIAENGLDGRVLPLGVVEDIPALIKSSDCVILPSLYEGLGLAALEAQACGVPCVASAGVPEEADLKLGLFKRLPLSGGDTWPDEIYRSAVLRRPPAEDIRRNLQTAGYDIRETAEYLSRLYEKK